MTGLAANKISTVPARALLKLAIFKPSIRHVHIIDQPHSGSKLIGPKAWTGFTLILLRLSLEAFSMIDAAVRAGIKYSFTSAWLHKKRRFQQ